MDKFTLTEVAYFSKIYYQVQTSATLLFMMVVNYIKIKRADLILLLSLLKGQ